MRYFTLYYRSESWIHHHIWKSNKASMKQFYFLFVLKTIRRQVIWPTTQNFFFLICSGIVSLLRSCSQNFFRPHSFPVVLCWNFEDCKFSLCGAITIFFFKYYIQIHITDITFFQNKIFWSSIACFEKNGILLKAWILLCCYISIILRIFFTR